MKPPYFSNLTMQGTLFLSKETVMLAIIADPAPGKNDRQTAEALIAKAVARL